MDLCFDFFPLLISSQQPILLLRTPILIYFYKHKVKISLLPTPQLLEQGPHAKGLHEKLLEELPVNFSRFKVIRLKMEMHQRYGLKSEYLWQFLFWGNWYHCTDWYEITCAGRDRYSGQRTPSPSYWSDPSPRFCLLHFCLWSHSSGSHLHLPPSLAPS